MKNIIAELLTVVRKEFDVHPVNTDEVITRELTHYLESEVEFQLVENGQYKIETLRLIMENPMDFLERIRFTFEMCNIMDE